MCLKISSRLQISVFFIWDLIENYSQFFLFKNNYIIIDGIVFFFFSL